MSLRRVAVISDVHGNLPALEAVLADLERSDPDLVVSCGDNAFGYLERETIDVLRALDRPVRFVLGNCDRDMAAEGQPDAERAAWLGGLEPTVTADVEGLGRVLLCHGTPQSEDGVLTEASPAAAFAAALEGVEAEIVVGGHTHMPFWRRVDARAYVNAGSVGRPYGEPGAHWLLLGPAVVARHTPYDYAAATRRLAGTRWGGDGYDLAAPVSRAEAVPVFERMAGRAIVTP